MFGAAVRAGGVMTDEEFQRLLAAVTALSPQQTAALQAALQLNAPDAPAAEAMVRGRDRVGWRYRSAFRARTVLPPLSGYVDYEMGFRQPAETVSLQAVRGHVQRADWYAVGPAAQAGAVVSSCASPRRRHLAAQGCCPPRCPSDDRIPLASSLFEIAKN